MSSRGKKKGQQRLKRLQDSLSDQRKRLEEMEVELANTLMTKTTVYLDTNHWVNLRHVVLGSRFKKPEYVEVLSCLERLQKSGQICCPVSSSMLEEVMTQSDTATRRATAMLMDTLSERICLQFLLKLARREWRHNIRQIQLQTESQRAFPIWTKAGFWAGQDALLGDISFWMGKPDDAIPAWIDRSWSMRFADLVELPEFQRIPHEMVTEFVRSMNDGHERAKASLICFNELRRREKLGLLESLKNDFLNELLAGPSIPPTEIFSSFVEEHNPWILPSLQVYASICAALMLSNRRVQESDVLDFMHAASAIPYCDAFICDNSMAKFLTDKPLGLGKIYDTIILSRPADIIQYLQGLAQ